jgi:hypothetical protein
MGITAFRLHRRQAEERNASPPRPPTLSELPREELEALARTRGEAVRRLENELDSVRGELAQARSDSPAESALKIDGHDVAEVIEGARKSLELAHEELSSKRAELEAANAEIARLHAQLQEPEPPKKKR